MRTADPSADGRRSAAIFATAELSSAGACRPAAPGAIHCSEYSDDDTMMAVAYYCEVLTHVCVEKFDVDAVNATCITRRSLLYMHTHTVVKLLSKRWWIPRGARPEGPTLEPEGLRAEFPTADQGLSSIQGTLFGFCGI